jgi:hypothetical protein
MMISLVSRVNEFAKLSPAITGSNSDLSITQVDQASKFEVCAASLLNFPSVSDIFIGDNSNVNLTDLSKVQKSFQLAA